MTSVHVVVAATSPLALLKLGNSSVLATAVNRARAAQCKPSMSVWLDASLAEEWSKLSDKRRPDCTVSIGATLLDVVQETDSDIVLVHDAQRPLTLPSTFDRVVNALSAEIGATRPSHIVVDTLKTVDADNRVTGTINRDLVQSLTSPEGFTRTSIDIEGVASEWSLPIKVDVKTQYVQGDPESLRIREPEDVLLVESFLAWQTLSR
ncbi:MAG: 2-C-methyl-D-erythritol 4-phosphate cytidylyltransferase [Actinomycetota bacterium]|jgi:2-C-methyl-D-erythritol 4-phosphate cytidylyltransferase